MVLELHVEMSLTFNNRRANAKRIARVSMFASTNRRVVHDHTTCIQTARSGARIDTTVILTSQMALAFGIYGTLGATVGWAAYVIRMARAGRCILAVNLANSVWSARRGNARVDRMSWRNDDIRLYKSVHMPQINTNRKARST